MTENFHTRRFNSIQALRGITALFVVLEHVRFLNCGAFGVDIFFIISGFMAMYTTHDNAKDFIKKRLIRIYPFYALMTIGTFFLLLLFPSMFQLTKADPVSLIKSLLFIPFEISEGIVQPLIRVGWTVNYEMLFYLIFALSCRICHKYRGLICSGFLCILVLLAHFLPINSTILSFYGDYIQLEFILGMLCYCLVRRLYTLLEESKITPMLSSLSLFAATVLFILLAVTKKQTPIAGMGRVLYWGIPAFIIVLFTFIADLNIKIPRPLVLLGNMSFSIYLIHYYPILFIDRKIYSLEYYSPMAIVVTVLGLFLVVGISYISYLLIEKKFSGYLRKFIK